MEIAALRTLFKEITGRYDFTDSRIDDYINAGVKLLDKLADYPQVEGRYFEVITAGDFKINISSISFAFYNVWVVDTAEDSREMLEKVSYDELKEYYSADFTGITRGTPLYWCPAKIRPIPPTITAAAFAGYTDYMDILFDADNPEDYDGVVVFPPADGTYLLEVEGRFASPELSDTHTKNWWTVRYPFEVIWAAAYYMEVNYRNTEGAKDWMNAIMGSTALVDQDDADQDSKHVNRMEG